MRRPRVPALLVLLAACAAPPEEGAGPGAAADCAAGCTAPDGGRAGDVGLADGSRGRGDSSGRGDDGGRRGGDGGGRGDGATDADACPCPTFDASVDTSDVAPTADIAVSITAPDPAPGAPFLIDLSTEDPLTATLQVEVGGATQTATLYRGRGSLLVTAPEKGPLPISVTAPGFGGERQLTVAERPTRTLTGTLAGADLAWDATDDVRVEGTAVVPAGATLTIAAGARVRLAAHASLRIQGSLEAAGSPESPILLTADTATPWGELTVEGTATLAHTWLVRGGGDTSRAFGHSGSQPVVRVTGTLAMTGGAVADAPGKAFGSSKGTVTLDGVLVTRVDTGGEHKTSAVTIRGSHFVEIPDADGVVTDDDNDGVYLNASGGPPCVVEDTTFAVGEDDAIDHNGATVRIERVWIEGFYHEGVAASNGGSVDITDAVIKGCAQGVEAGYGAPEVTVTRSLLTGNGVGLRWGDSYDWTTEGTLTVTAIVAAGNTTDTRFDDDQQGPAPEGAVTVTCSALGAGAWSADGCVDPASVTLEPGCGPVGPQAWCP